VSQLVIDASVAIAAILVEDRTQEARDIVRRAVAGLVVPFLWPVEVGNVLLLGERRGRFSADSLSEGAMQTHPETVTTSDYGSRISRT